MLGRKKFSGTKIDYSAKRVPNNFGTHFQDTMSTMQANQINVVILNYVRIEYEHMYEVHVPMPIKQLITEFSKPIIGCKFLTYKEDLDFLTLLETTLSNINEFQLLFTASDHNYSGNAFHSFCDEKVQH